jgi:hypothetical protein
MTPYVRAWLWAFLFTQAVEVPIVTRALGRHRDRELRALPPITRAAIAFGASTLTHPVVWFVIPRLAPGGYVAMVIQAELFAVVVEAMYYHAFGLQNALLWSLFANCASAGLGLLSRAIFGWP